MGMMDAGLAQHFATLSKPAIAGEPATYIRGDSSIPITVVIGNSDFEEVGADGEIRAQTKSVDFLVNPAELILSGSAIEPQRGDRIQKQNGDVFDLLQGSNGSAWRWSEGRQIHYRIHTVRRVKS